MDNYFILSPKEGDKCIRAASNMTSVKLETCILIVETYFLWGDLTIFASMREPLLGAEIIISTMNPFSYHCT